MSLTFNRTVLMSGTDFFNDSFAINPLMDSAIPVDRQKAMAEHTHIRKALESAGVKVVKVAPPPDCQDGVYTANWALVRGGTALMARLPNKRQAEEAYAEEVLKNLGLKIVHLPGIAEVQASSSRAFSRRGMERAVSKYSEVNAAGEKRSGTEEASRIDGSADKQARRPGLLRFSGQGDALPCGDIVFTQSPYRTSPEAHSYLKSVLGFKEVIALQTKPSRWFGFGPPKKNKITGWPDSPTYDLDLALAILKWPADGQSGLIAWCPEVFLPKSRTILRQLTDVDKIEVSKAEALSAYALNLVSTGEMVIMNAGAPKLQAALASHGLKTITLDLPELKKGGGSIRCTTLTLDN